MDTMIRIEFVNNVWVTIYILKYVFATVLVEKLSVFSLTSKVVPVVSVKGCVDTIYL